MIAQPLRAMGILAFKPKVYPTGWVFLVAPTDRPTSVRIGVKSNVNYALYVV